MGAPGFIVVVVVAVNHDAAAVPRKMCPANFRLGPTQSAGAGSCSASERHI